jgi:hypothetical protein
MVKQREVSCVIHSLSELSLSFSWWFVQRVLDERPREHEV